MRAGWLLLLLQPLAIVALGVLAAAFIDGTRWLVVFVPLIVVFVVWIGQALDAYHRALQQGHAAGGEWAILAVLPVMLTALTVFWLIGGRHGSPSATLQAYTDAWVSGRPDVAGQLFAEPRAPDDVAHLWAAERRAVIERIARARATHGADSGLDPNRPFDSLRFRETASPDGRVAMIAEIVRSQRVETTLFGFVPTASQETVVVEPDVTIWLTLEPQPMPDWLAFLRLESFAWRVHSIAEPPPG